MRFVAFWPITDPSVPANQLVQEATETLPMLAARAHARITEAGRWSIRPSASLPGSGRVAETVLFFEAAAEQMEQRDYWKGAA